MDGRSNVPQDLSKPPPTDPSLPKSNKSVPRGLLYRELGFKQKENSVSAEFQRAAEDRLVLKHHQELSCELPDVSRSTFLMVFSPDGTKVASTHGNHNVYVTDLNTGKNVNTLSGHPRTPWCIAFHPSSNQILASGCLGGQVRVWDLHGGSEIWTAESQTVIASLAFHPTDRMLVIATYNELHFWDWSQPIPFTKCYTSNEKEKVRYVAFDPLGHKLITGISNAPHNHTQWDRVATPSRQGSNITSTSSSSSHSTAPRSNSMNPPDHERRITVCYRSLVEQYEQLVQRYYDLSRLRSTATMDRGTDPMDLSESSASGNRSGTTGTQSQSQTGNNRSRMNLPSDSGASSGNTSASGSNSSCGSNTSSTGDGVESNSGNNADNNPRPRPSDRPLRNIPSVVLMHRLIRRLDRDSSLLPCERTLERPQATPPASQNLPRVVNLSTRRYQDSEPNTGSEPPQPGVDRPHSNTGATQRPLDEERQSTSDSTSRDPNGQPPASSPTSERCLFARLHSPPCPAERPRRFFVSQRSAFQPRAPRGYVDRVHPNTRPSTRSYSSLNQSSGRSFLHRRLAGSYFSQNLHDEAQSEDSPQSESSSHQGIDSTSDVGVRYGIQLLSRHIDNMQRLCRARLEILQLQQIRRMWEDLQRQIRSLHVAVRESTFALTDTPEVSAGRGTSRRRFRLYSHPREGSDVGTTGDSPLRRNSWRSGESESSSVEHIPSVSQMLELARISDIGPSQGSSQTSVPASSADTSNQQPSSSREQNSSKEDLKKGTLAKLRAQFVALAKLKFVAEKTNGSREEGESSRNASSDGDIDSSSISDRPLPSDSEPTASQSANLVNSEIDKKPVPGSSSQSTDVPVSTEHLVSDRTVESTCEDNTESNKCDQLNENKADDEEPSPSKKKRGEETIDKSVKQVSSAHSSMPSDSTSITQDTSSIPTIQITTNTTTTTVTSSSVMEQNNSSKQISHSDQPCESTSPNINNWSRCSTDSSPPTTSSPATTQTTTFTNPPSSNTSSIQQRFLRISRRVYLRRPRLLALGPRSRSMARQLGSGSSSHRSFPASIFRHHDYGRRPWFMQSTPLRSQHTRTSQRGVNTAAQVDTRGTQSESEGSESNQNSASNESNTNQVISSSNTSRDVSASDQSSSSGGASLNKSGPCDSSQSDAQPGPSGLQKEKTVSGSSNQQSEDTPHGKKRKAENLSTMTPEELRSAEAEVQRTIQREQSTCESLRAMIARLEALVRQQREQREAARQELQDLSLGRGGGRRTNLWGLRERPIWIRGDGNSGSDSDSNPESDRGLRWRRTPDERLIAFENELNRNLASGPHHERSGPIDDDYEWTRESTRLRARQVLSLMVESLTQFFEENGLSNSTSHAVLDEQIYNLYILLQLALELTDLLLAQLVSTRRALEHQWVNRLRSPVALDDSVMTADRGIEERRGQSRRRGGGGGGGGGRSPSRDGNGDNVGTEEQSSEDGNFQPRRRTRGEGAPPATTSDEGGFAEEHESRRRVRAPIDPLSRPVVTRIVPQPTADYYRLSTFRHYRQYIDCIFRNTQTPFTESGTSQYAPSNPGYRGRSTPSTGVNRGDITRRLGPRVNYYSRHGPHGSMGSGGRLSQGTSSRPLIRGAMTRRDSAGVRLPSYARDSGIRVPPYTRSSPGVRLPGGVHVPSFEDHSGPSPVRPPHVMVRVHNPIPMMSASASQQDQRQEQPQEQQQQSSTRQQQDAFTVPLVRVNDVLIPDTSILNQPQPRQRPQSPPPHPSPHLRNPFIQHQQLQQQAHQPQSPLRYLGNPSPDVWRLPGSPGEGSWRSGWRPRFLHPRYMAPNPFIDDNDEPLIGAPLENINFIRDSFIIADAPMSPNHRIQAWDFSKLSIPDISNAEKNVVVAECKIHNDASVDVSNDGRLLVTLLPTGRLSSTAMLGVYSLEWESLGQCLYTTSFEQNAVSVSLSPASRHLLVGLASRRVALLPSDRHTMAQIFRLEGGAPGRTVGARGRLCHVRDIEQDREQGFMSLNCIRWAPRPGQGLVYGTNTGKLRVLR